MWPSLCYIKIPRMLERGSWRVGQPTPSLFSLEWQFRSVILYVEWKVLLVAFLSCMQFSSLMLSGITLHPLEHERSLIIPGSHLSRASSLSRGKWSHLLHHFLGTDLYILFFSSSSRYFLDLVLSFTWGESKVDFSPSRGLHSSSLLHYIHGTTWCCQQH